MQHDGVRDRCQYFHFEHSPAYQKVQLRFWEAVDTLDPNSIAVSGIQYYSIYCHTRACVKNQACWLRFH